MPVPLLDLKAQYQSLRDELRAVLNEVAESQALILGPQVEQLEKSIAAYCGADHAIGISSGTDAELIALMALEIGPGDRVLTTPYTFFATASCVSRVGATPVFVDIDPGTFNLSIPALRHALEHTPNVKAIIPVHLFGLCAEMDEILALGREYRVPVLEDAAQALGSQYVSADGSVHGAGAMGDLGWFSFYPTKNLGAFGDAGMVVCRSEELATKLRALRNHGMETRYYHKWLGGNFRLDALQAAVLNVKLPHLDRWHAARRAHAEIYRAEFARLDLAEILTLPAEPLAAHAEAAPNHHIYNQFVIRGPRRDELRAHLQAHGIGSEIYYPLSLHQQECFAELGGKAGDFPESERAAAETLALPIFPELKPEQLHEVAAAIRAFYR